MAEFRHAPADFAQVAQTMTNLELKQHYRAGARTIARWVREIGGKQAYVYYTQPAPADFAQIAAVKCRDDIMAHYDIGERKLDRWLRETGVQPPRKNTKSGPKLRQVPDDFEKVAPRISTLQAQRTWKASYQTVARWSRETGVGFLPYTPTGGKSITPTRGNTPLLVLRDTRKMGIHDRAADDLRRDRWTVFRCDDKGVYAENGNLWRVGNIICDGDELLARAARATRKAA